MIGDLVTRRDAVTGWQGPVTDFPIELLQTLSGLPLPVTIGGSNNVTFTLVASKTRPVPIFNGRNFAVLTRSLVYTWNATSNPILNSSGVETTDTDSVLGVWYMYLNAACTDLIPSQTKPSYVEGPNNAGLLGHPGTSRTQFYRYVGFMVCTTAATPAFRAMTKVGFTYHFAAQSVDTTATWAALDFSASVPAHGVLVAGHLETGAAGTVVVSGSSVEDQGVLKASVSATGEVIFAPFGPIAATLDGKIWAKDTVARGDVHISQVVDIN